MSTETSTHELEFDVEGMTCANCARRVEKVLRKVQGVQTCEIDLVRERARISTGPGVSIAALEEAVAAAGYGLRPHERIGPREPRRASRPAAVRAAAALGLALAAMASSMVPGAPGRPWLEVVLAGLCVFGPGLGIVRKAAREVRARAAGMDTLVALGALSAMVSAVVQAAASDGRVGTGHEAFHGTAVDHTFAESGAMIVAFVLLGRALEERAKRAAGDAMRALESLVPETARVVRHGMEATIPTSELRAGDEVRVGAHGRVPADGTLLGEDVLIDMAWLTGESTPVLRRVGERVLAGALAAGAAMSMRVDAVGEGTELARVERLVAHAQASKAPIVRMADRVSAVFVPAMLGVAGLTAIVHGFWGAGLDAALQASITVLVVACPCALGLATPTAVTVAVGRAARRGILVRDAAALETLANVRIVALDKTGTLTEGHPTLLASLAVEGDPDHALARAAAVERESEHPIGEALVNAAVARGLPSLEARGVVARAGQGVRGEVDGVHVEVTSVDEAALVEVGPSLAAKVAGLRQAAASVVAVRLDGRIAAFFAVRDVVRPGAAEAVSRLRALGLGVRMWSGDHAVAARAVGSELGMTVDEVRAGLSPEGKADALAALSGVGPVAMVGDGVNDAPALALSAVGIAMGGGAASARQTAGITLVHPDPRLIAEAVALSRRTMRIVRQNLGWAFGYNLVMVPLAATGQLERFGGPMLASAAMAGSSITVVLNSLRLRRTRLEASRPMPER